MNVVVLADTHLRGGLDRLPGPLLEALAAADVILHAGDVVSVTALTELRRLGPVHAVLGNNDHELAGLLPEELRLDLGGVEVAMVHDSGPTKGRPGRLARRFPGAQLVVFGHSHVPVDEVGLDGQVLLNPGSPTQRRSQPVPTFGRLRLVGGRIAERSIEPLGPGRSLGPERTVA